MQSLLLLLLLLCNSSVRANIIPKPPASTYCVDACVAVIGRIKFNGKSAQNPPCSRPLAVDSLFSCVTRYCSQDEAISGLQYTDRTCSENGEHLPLYTRSNHTVPTLITAKQIKQNFTEAVIPNEEYFQTVLKATVVRYEQIHSTWNFVFTLYGYWGLVILVGILHRAWCHTRGVKSWSSAIDRSLAIPRLQFSPRAQSPPPTRLLAITITSYIILCLVLCFPAHDTVQTSIYYETRQIELAKYISNRLGTLAVANIPLVWFFAIRNSPLLWLTGWSYSTFSQFHRWTARLTALLVVSHGISYSITNTYKKTYFSVWDEQYWQCGVVSLLMFCLLIAGSLSFVRARAYDAFLLVHISFAAVVLAGVYYHLDELSERVTYHRFLWIAIDIWVFDRLLRILRVVYINMKPVVLKGTQAILNQPEGSDLLRVEVTDFFPAGRSFNPGQHYFIYEPARLRGYECHPFTLCSWTYAAPRPREHAIEQNKELGITSVRSSVDSANEDSTLDDSPMRHSFLIRPRGGFTKRLQDRFLASSPDLDDEGRARGVPVRILLEGPYQSDPTSTRSPSSLLLIIGGSGITSAISRIYDALQRSPDLHVHLVWIVRSRATVDDVCAHELSGLRGRPGFEMSVYVTSLSASLPDVEKMDFAAANYALHSGRPNVGAIIGEERGKCTAAESGGLSVFCCGPLSLASSCRDAVQDALKQNGANLEFHEEDFGF